MKREQKLEVKDYLPRRLPLALPAAWSRNSFLDPSRVMTASNPEVMHAYIQGLLGANSGEALQEVRTASLVNGLVMAVHRQMVKQAAAAGFGLLLVAGGL